MAIGDMTIIGRSLMSRLFSTITTLLMVGVSVALMLVLLTMRDAGFKAFEQGSGNMHMIVSRDDSAMVSVLNGVFYADAPRRPIEWAKYNEIATRFPLEYAVPIQQGDSYSGFPVLATNEDFWTKFSPFQERGMSWTLRDGEYFDEAFEVVLGATVADQTGLQIGDRIYLTHGMGASGVENIAPPAGGDDHDHDHDHDHAHDDHEHEHDHDHAHDDHEQEHEQEHEHGAHVHREYPCEIVGILDRTGGPHDRALFTHLDTSWVLHKHDMRIHDDPRAALTTLDDLTDDDRLITGIYIRVITREGSMLSAGMQQVFDVLRRDPTITVAAPSNQIKNIFNIVSNVDDVFIGMAGVVLVSSALAIMLALYNSMASRRRQIAVLRVLGTSRGRIFGLIVTESAVIGFLGAVIGVVASLGGAQVVAELMRARLGGVVFSPQLEPALTLTVVIGTVFLAALAGVVPAVVAYRTSVAKHLRPLT